MYGLPQVGLQPTTSQFLAPHGYAPCPITPGLWQHATWLITFALVVDDFAVTCTHVEDAMHLMMALDAHYQVSKDWDATRY